MSTSIKEFGKTGMIAMTYPADLRRGVDKAVESWKKFCELPTEVKKGLKYSNTGTGVGYELKLGVGANADRKENFDVANKELQWLEQHAADIHNPIAEEFVRNAAALVELIKPTVFTFARLVEKEYGLQDFEKEVRESGDAFFFRFIHYFGDRKLNEETASAHADQSGFTFHLYESAPGLQCLTYDHEWIPMPVSSGETVVIPAMQLQLRSNGTLRALCHRVIATPETVDAGRYSVVCFIQLKHTRKYDKDRCGRLQEKPAGFNYDMLPGEFSELFKPN